MMRKEECDEGRRGEEESVRQNSFLLELSRHG